MCFSLILSSFWKDFETRFDYLFHRASLPVIMSLLGLWLVLFLFFAILFVEVFGLTKWGGVETRTTNYYSLGGALVMLAFQSTGFVTRFHSILRL